MGAHSCGEAILAMAAALGQVARPCLLQAQAICHRLASARRTTACEQGRIRSRRETRVTVRREHSRQYMRHTPPVHKKTAPVASIGSSACPPRERGLDAATNTAGHSRRQTFYPPISEVSQLLGAVYHKTNSLSRYAVSVFFKAKIIF